ncbi:hypothetical protein PV620_26515, partial [Streptomyces sp. ME02-6978a]|nr:hypothetical protein [Streptomyces sp. ME02-6978a]
MRAPADGARTVGALTLSARASGARTLRLPRGRTRENGTVDIPGTTGTTGITGITREVVPRAQRQMGAGAGPPRARPARQGLADHPAHPGRAAHT